MPRYNQTPHEKEQEVINLFKQAQYNNESISATEIERRTGVKFFTVLNIIRRRGETPRYPRKYRFNENFFEYINSPDKAYWLGFIFADGCISQGRDLIIGLQKKDKGHLVKFLSAIEGNNRISEVNNNGFPGVRLAIRSRLMCGHLQRVGVSERKSLTATPPELRTDLIHHFWRGVFDGDGHLCFYKQANKYKIFEFGICGSKETINGFIKFVLDETGIVMPLRPDHNIWRTRKAGKKAKRILDLLYSNSNVYLDRKRVIYDQY